MELEKGVRRWVVDVSKWNPSPHSFSFAMSFLPNHEFSSITRFVKLEDRKRALVSRLLQYVLVHQVLAIPFDEIIIRRTAEGKPFLYVIYSAGSSYPNRGSSYPSNHKVCDDNMESAFPNFNFNVSHHGDYVVIASEPICIVGLDIVSYSIPRSETTDEFIHNFSSYFSSLEWLHVINAPSSDEMLKSFYRYWCLKEAFVKAIGSGVGYELNNVEFHHTEWDNIFVKVAGNELKNDWKFWLQELGNYHSVSIARGHPRNAIASYKRTLKQTTFDDNEYNRALHLPNPSFTFHTVEDLVQLCHRADWISIDLPRKPHTSDDDDKIEKISHVISNIRP